jgi:antitoxin MazE
MKSMHLVIRRIGNSHGFVIPKPMLVQLGFEGEAEMSIEGDALVLRKPARHVRAGWAEAGQRLAAHDDDALVMGEFANEGDSELAW